MNKKAIICVDDERMVLISLRDQLVRYLGNEYNIELAESAEEALELFEELQEEEYEIPLLIADQIMPGMKGDELLIEIYSQYPKTLKILLTGQASGEAVGNAVNFANLYRYIAKPWDEADLRLTVAEAIRSYFQEKQVSEQNKELQKVNIELQQLNSSLEQRVTERTVELAKAEAELRAIFAAMTELIFVIDQQGKYLKVISNDSALLYNSAENLLGKTIYEVFEAKQADTFLECIQQALHTQQTVSIEYKLTIGEQFFWFAANISPISSISVIWVARDMTERKFLEEKLRTSEEKIRAVFEAMTDIVLVIDEKKSIELAPTNIRKLYDFEADPINKTVEHFLLGETNKNWLEKVDQALITQETIYFDYSLTLNNRETWFAASISPMPNNSVIWVARNIDDRKMAEAVMEQAKVAAEAANQAKSDFLANMSHELRTPLNGILGYAQILQLDKDCTSKQQNGLEIIYKCGEHLLNLINDILDLAKIEAQKLDLYANDFNLPYFLKGVSDICRIKAEQKKINFIYQPINQLPDIVNADEKRLRQVLINLISNAIKFTDAGSVTFKVEVIENLATDIVTQEIDGVAIDNTTQLSLTSSNNSSIQSFIKIRFQIEDTGIGMTSDQLEKIFSPFEQVGDTSRRIEGTGLGLSITKKIISMMKSEIFVESLSGVGSLFRFDLNLPETAKPIQSTTLNFFYNIIGYQGEKHKILVIDDNSENCSVIINILEPIGFEVQSAFNGQEGLKQAVEFQPDLIITDLMMPVMDGFEMARQLRKSPEFTHTPILATSARVFEFEQQKSQQFGCQDFISKPIKVEELLQKIKHYLKLNWIYSTHNVIEANSASEPLSAIVMPPVEELTNIYKAAQIGDNEDIKQEATRIKQLDSKYTQFVNKLLELADDFKNEEIMKMIEEVTED
ncbi:MAG: response regulator [Coleofasciculaceae cyanobacterium]